MDSAIIASVPEVVVPPLKDLGPAMRALTPKRRKFVLAYMHYGMQKGFGTKSAKVAGYNGNESTLKSNAYQLLRMPKVIAAFNEEIAKGEVMVGWRAKIRVSEIAESENETTALAANKLLLEMTGNFIKRTEMTVRHEIAEIPTEELERRIEAELQRIAQERLALNPPIEGEFVVVDKMNSPLSEVAESPLAVAVDSRGAENGDSSRLATT